MEIYPRTSRLMALLAELWGEAEVDDYRLCPHDMFVMDAIDDCPDCFEAALARWRAEPCSEDS